MSILSDVSNVNVFQPRFAPVGELIGVIEYSDGTRGFGVGHQDDSVDLYPEELAPIFNILMSCPTMEEIEIQALNAGFDATEIVSSLHSNELIVELPEASWFENHALFLNVEILGKMDSETGLVQCQAKKSGISFELQAATLAVALLCEQSFTLVDAILEVATSSNVEAETVAVILFNDLPNIIGFKAGLLEKL